MITKVKKKRELPFTKIEWTIPLDYTTFNKAWKRGRPDIEYLTPDQAIGMKDGTVWIRCSSEAVFWAHVYYECSEVVANRLRAINEVISGWE